MTLFERLFPSDNRSRLWVLIDPDSAPSAELAKLAEAAEREGAGAILVGGSMLFHPGFDKDIQTIKDAISLPVILFPGSSRQLSAFADGLLFTSLLSGRNPQYLIDEQVHAAPIVRKLDLETIPTAYLLIESGNITTAQFVSNTNPIPRMKPMIAVAHVQAAELLGFKAIYLEAGSGAEKSVPEDMIRMVKKAVLMPLIVGGGIKNAKDARAAADAGANAIVVGTAIERGGVGVISEISTALKML
ncbi:geranylgeranylglyceryl/heptaprenylglyceryl phosphate synthase [bacterium]|nr:geranylgeranylglyceryl/heptaprenylglyceryl phosphate synthase [bacterium]